MCGMCLAVCPTYRKSGNEAESPRGRIALMRAVAEGQLQPSPDVRGPLDRCLACRACEAICPADVPYGELIDAARDMIQPDRYRSPASRTLRRLGLSLAGASPTTLRTAGHLVRAYQRSGLQRLAHGTGLLRVMGLQRAENLLPPLSPPRSLAPYHPPTGSERGQVALFTGCVGQAMDTDTLDHAITVLTAAGFAVHVPQGQRCCGALHLHSGHTEQARALARSNWEAFSELQVSAVVGTATGCTATLGECGNLLGKAHWPTPVMDINAFLAQHWPRNLPLAPLAARVGVHVPCSMRHVLRDEVSVLQLLRYVPELEPVPLPSQPACCGAAGDYMLRHPDMADALRADLMDFVAAQALEAVATANVGCALHLAAGLRERGLPVAVLHPVSLLAQRLSAARPAREQVSMS